MEQMSKNRIAKVAVVAEIVEKLKGAQSLVVCSYSGLTVEQVTNLRKLCREKEVQYCVLKNRLVMRALQELGITDSVYIYCEKAREFCNSLPYNSGMVDVDLLHGIYLTDKGGDAMHLGIQELQNVTQQGTVTNQAKAFHQLAQTYLKSGNSKVA